MKTFYVYILASTSGTLYTGITNDIKRRVFEHKNHLVPGFTDKHNIDKLLYIETFRNVDHAIKREKQIKGWKREKKIKLIDQENPQRNDLSAEWFD
jgi:putative endonuclease